MKMFEVEEAAYYIKKSLATITSTCTFTIMAIHCSKHFHTVLFKYAGHYIFYCIAFFISGTAALVAVIIIIIIPTQACVLITTV